MIILLIIWFLKFFLLSRFCLVFLPTTFTSLPPRVMLLNRSAALRDGTTDIENIYRKGTPERERPNRSVVINLYYPQSTYSPDFRPCNYWMFPTLNHKLHGSDSNHFLKFPEISRNDYQNFPIYFSEFYEMILKIS